MNMLTESTIEDKLTPMLTEPCRSRWRARTSPSSTATSRPCSTSISTSARSTVTALHRPVRLRQVDLPALPQPHERHDRRLPGRRADHDRRRGHLRSVDRRGRAARPGRHGVPEAEPVPEVDLRERRLRPAHPRPGAQSKAELDEIVEISLQKRRPLGRGQGPAARARHRPVRRPAAAPVHRPRHRRLAGSHPDGRALLGARSDRDRQGRGTDRRTAAELHDRHRHAFDAAGGPRLAAHGDVPSRQPRRGGRDREDVHQPDDQRTQDYITGRFG